MPNILDAIAAHLQEQGYKIHLLESQDIGQGPYTSKIKFTTPKYQPNYFTIRLKDQTIRLTLCSNSTNTHAYKLIDLADPKSITRIENLIHKHLPLR